MDGLNLIGLFITILFLTYIYQLMLSGPYIQRKSNKYRIKIYRKQFKPKFLNINRGDTVSWKNYDIIRHSITSKYPTIPNSPVLEPDVEFDHTFTSAGKYTFKSSFYNGHEPLNIRVRDVAKGNEFMNNVGNNFQITVNNIKLWISHRFASINKLFTILRKKLRPINKGINKIMKQF